MSHFAYGVVLVLEVNDSESVAAGWRAYALANRLLG